MHIRKIKKIIIVFILLQISFQLKAQLPISNNPYIPIIQKQIAKIDSLKGYYYDTYNFLLDSINIYAKIWNGKIETINNFKNSNTEINITIYFQNNKLVFANCNEKSKKYNKLAASITNIYYFEGKQILTYTKFLRPTGVAMMPNDDTYTFWGYNKNLNKSFLSNYIIQLFEKINSIKN